MGLLRWFLTQYKLKRTNVILSFGARVVKMFDEKKKNQTPSKMGTYYLTSKSQLCDNSSLSGLVQASHDSSTRKPGQVWGLLCIQAQFSILFTYRLNLSLIVTQWSEKTLMLGGIGGRRRRGCQRMRWLDGITDLMDVEFEWTLGVGDEQGGLACWDSWGKESDTTERLNWTDSWFTVLISAIQKSDSVIIYIDNIYMYLHIYV